MKRFVASVLAVSIVAPLAMTLGSVPDVGAAPLVAALEPADGLCSTSTGGLVEATTRAGGLAGAALVTTADDPDCDGPEAFDFFAKPAGGSWFGFTTRTNIAVSRIYSYGNGTRRLGVNVQYSGAGLTFRFQAYNNAGSPINDGQAWTVYVPSVQLGGDAVSVRITGGLTSGDFSVQPEGSAAVSKSSGSAFSGSSPGSISMDWGSIAGTGGMPGIETWAMTQNNGGETLPGTFPGKPDIFDESWIDELAGTGDLPIPDVSDLLDSWVSGLGICDEEPTGWWTWIPLSTDFAGLACNLLSGIAWIVGRAVDAILWLANPIIQVWWDIARPVLVLMARVGAVVWEGLKAVWDAVWSTATSIASGVGGVIGDVWDTGWSNLTGILRAVFWSDEAADEMAAAWDQSGGEWADWISDTGGSVSLSQGGTFGCGTIEGKTICASDALTAPFPTVLGNFLSAIVVVFGTIEVLGLVASVIKVGA